MTTVAWDGKQLAVDSQATAGDSIDHYRNKMIFLKNGSAAACAGLTSDSVKFKRVMNQGGDVKLSENFEAIVAKNGKAEYFDDSLIPRKLKPPYAIGSGWKWATAAMDHGRTAVEAVKYASKKDTQTGGRVNHN